MPKTLFIHIGTHKTGSTAIQNLLLLNKPELLKNGVLFPGSSDDHYQITNELRESEKPYLNRETQAYKIFTEIKSNLHYFDTFIISSEGFCENYELILPRLADIIAYFNLQIDIKIIIFYRYQASNLESTYQQYVKQLSTRLKMTFRHFLELHCYSAVFDYYLLLNCWSKYFDRNDMLILPFIANREKSNLYSTFLNAVNLQLTENYQLPTLDKINKGFSNNSLDFLRWLNILEVDNVLFLKISDILKLRETNHQTNYNFLSRDEEDRVMQSYEKSNYLVATDFLNRSDGKLFPNRQSHQRTMNQVYLQEDEFRPESFEDIFGLIKKENDNILTSLYVQIFTINSNDMVTFNAKHQFLAVLEKFVSALQIKTIKKTHKYDMEENIQMINKSKDWDVLLHVTKDNFHRCTFNFSKDCKGNFQISDHKIKIESTGNDPFFSLQKVTGNFDSETFLIITVSSTCDTKIQIFFQTRSQTNYTESNSFCRSIQEGENTVCFLIDHIEFNGQIRIDPGCNKGEYILHEIVIRSNVKSYEKLYEEYLSLKKIISN
ncbi:MAG: hypothetical protein HOO86_03205 [Bacteroidales bacterium]|nr:hypothetical protein [Bacteroidales bacterium]